MTEKSTQCEWCGPDSSGPFIKVRDVTLCHLCYSSLPESDGLEPPGCCDLCETAIWPLWKLDEEYVCLDCLMGMEFRIGEHLE
jgi:hypothetical protein